MNLILLFDEDFLSDDVVQLDGRRLQHVTGVHRAAAGDTLVVGRAGGMIGTGVVLSLSPLQLRVSLSSSPPPPLPLTLVLALPRPKVLNRVIAGATSMGIKCIYLINAWRVEKSYWKSPRLSEENLREQSILGLEQARDTVLPVIEKRRFFAPFLAELTSLAAGSLALAAHPSGAVACPRGVTGPVTLVIGPEGGFIAEEVASLERAGCTLVTFGERILRVETALGWAVGRLF